MDAFFPHMSLPDFWMSCFLSKGRKLHELPSRGMCHEGPHISDMVSLSTHKHLSAAKRLKFHDLGTVLQIPHPQRDTKIISNKHPVLRCRKAFLEKLPRSKTPKMALTPHRVWRFLLNNQVVLGHFISFCSLSNY